MQGLLFGAVFTFPTDSWWRIESSPPVHVVMTRWSPHLLGWINVYAQYEIENHADDNQGCPDQHDVGDFLFFVVDPSPDKRVEGADDAQYPQAYALFLEQFDEDED